MKLAFTPEADEQAGASDLRWRANRPKAPGLFAAELAAAKALIVATPKPFTAQTRRILRIGEC